MAYMYTYYKFQEYSMKYLPRFLFKQILEKKHDFSNLLFNHMGISPLICVQLIPLNR